MEIQNRLLIGLGLDGNDGHVRITKGRDFRLFGGSEDTHEMMQEKAVRLCEAVEKNGKTLGTISEDELIELTNRYEIPYCRIRQQVR